MRSTRTSHRELPMMGAWSKVQKYAIDNEESGHGVLFWMRNEHHCEGYDWSLSEIASWVVHRVHGTSLIVAYCSYETWAALRATCRTLSRTHNGSGDSTLMVGAAFRAPRDVAEIAAVLWNPLGSGRYAHFEHAVDAAKKLTALS